jgi:hypothetical protein
MNRNEDMKVVFVVNYMACQQVAVEFLSISHVYGAFKNRRTSAISYCLFDGGMRVRDSNNRVSTACRSQ